ncbi:MAG: alkaline phosphatase family protein [Myxococcota bacterium]
MLRRFLRAIADSGHYKGRVRALVLGLDCVPPSLAFERWADAMPVLQSLRERGRSGPLRSSSPPITVPAWACMTTGRDPGELGLYGFRNLPPERGYTLKLAGARDLRVKRVWEHVGDAGHRVAALFVPPSNPPRPVNGVALGCFLSAPGAPWAFPRRLEAELEGRFGEFRPDVRDFRNGDEARILAELDAMTAQHFAIARAVIAEQAPALTMAVMIGPDRLHHAFWHHLDPASPGYRPGNPWEAEARAYYARLDAQLGRLVATFEAEAGDEGLVLVVSDHGARALEGAVAVNELLRAKGWQVWRREPDGITPLRDVVDWSRTRAWAEGGYYARVFLNVAGREPEGVVPPERYEASRRELAELLRSVPGPKGPLPARVDRPEEVYGETRGEPPDLMVYFADLAYRALGTVGHGGVLAAGDDRGVDGCNHAWDGIYVAAGPRVRAGAAPGAIVDVAPTILDAFGVARPPRMRGVSWLHPR